MTKEIYGQYANVNFTVDLNNQPVVTYRGFDITLSDIDQQPCILLYIADNLDETHVHTAKLTNLYSLPARPFFFDYANVLSTKK